MLASKSSFLHLSGSSKGPCCVTKRGHRPTTTVKAAAFQDGSQQGESNKYALQHKYTTAAFVFIGFFSGMIQLLADIATSLCALSQACAEE